MPYDPHKQWQYDPFGDYDSALAAQQQAAEERRYGAFWELDGHPERDGLGHSPYHGLYHRDNTDRLEIKHADNPGLDAENPEPPYIPAKRMRQVLDKTSPGDLPPQLLRQRRPEGARDDPPGADPFGMEEMEIDILLERLQDYRMQGPPRPTSL